MPFKIQLIPILNHPIHSDNIEDVINQTGEYTTICVNDSCQQKSIENITVVVDEDTGFIIPSVFDYLLTRYKEGKDNSSFEARALRLYFDFIEMMPGLEWDKGSELNYERPIYQFSKFLENQYGKGEIAGTTANNYFSCVTRFYSHHLKFSYPFKGGVPIEFNETVIKKYDNDLTSHITGLEIRIKSADCKPNISVSKKTELVPFSQDEVKLFFNQLSKYGSEELLLMCLLSYSSGMRADEIADLKVDMISRYSNTESFTLRLGPISGHKTKKNNDMPVTVPGKTIAVLLKYNKSKRYLERLKKSNTNRAHVFLNRNGKPYDQKTISTLFSEFIRTRIAHLIKEFNHKFHDLRVSFGVNTMKACIKANWERTECLAYTKKQMRHKNLETTQLYLEYWEKSVAIKEQARVNDEILKDVYEMLEQN